jgi:hypothetical protein
MDVSPAQARELAEEIDQDGFAVIHNYVSDDELRVAQRFASDAVARNNGNYLSINGAEPLSGTFLGHIAKDESFIHLCRNVYSSGTGLSAPDSEFYQVFRCLAGPQARQHSLQFHYDSYVLTALFPIIIPSDKERGNLIVFPSTRPIRALYLMNLVDKVVVDNKLVQVLIRAAYRKNYRTVSIELQPGSLYFFWGYRSLHANDLSAPHEIRSTALLHYVDPHAQSRLKRFLRGIRSALRPSACLART